MYILITSHIKVMSQIQRPLRPASVLSMMMMMMMVAERKDGGGGVCRAANGTVPITGFSSIGRVGVLFVIYAVLRPTALL